MKSLIEFYITGTLKIISKLLLMNFFEKLFFEKRDFFFLKGNEMKGGYKDALRSGRDKYIVKNYITV